MKLIPLNIKYKAEFTNTDIRNITDITGFLDVITNKLDNTAAKAKISCIKNIIKLSYKDKKIVLFIKQKYKG
jgi:hypothetical protein